MGRQVMTVEGRGRMSHVSATLSLLLCAAFQQAAAFSCTAPANPLQCFSGISHLYSRPVASNSLNANRAALPLLRTARTMTTMSVASPGDLAIVNWSIKLADGQELPEDVKVFDQGKVKFVVGEGGFLPCLHKKVEGMKAGEKKTFDVPPSEAFGEKNPMMGPVDLPGDAAPPGLQVGMMVQLSNGMKARVTKVSADSITIDANKPLAGAEVKMEVEVLELEPGAVSLETADFALGCFWGAELAFQREPGVVSTKVGYTQGQKEKPSYEQVCSGTTGHTECVQLRFDPEEVTYERLCDLFWDRLGENRFLKNQVGNDRGTQYRHGIYYHNLQQKAIAEAALQALWATDGKSATETIRCYG